ncbi:MAG: class I SAM-dependent methyltransferase [Hyphomicrobiaceae bacterium]|nr:class I SAM-dependent methyltransferase [Hyphomicrobiaceae bacterium]
MSETQAEAGAVDRANAGFWNELCGSQLARSLGVTDSSPASLKRFDDWYFRFYPYLDTHIRYPSLQGRDVLEVGLGYGSVAQKLAQAGANYTGLDIAAGPVAMVNHRLAQLGLPGKAVQGSVLEAPFGDASFDTIVAIGCLHHTGNLARAIDECHRLLRPGGQLVFMVYYAYSYRRFLEARKETLDYLKRERGGYHGVFGSSTSGHRKSYDANVDGDAAPHTDWISRRSLAQLCHKFKTFDSVTENATLGRFDPFMKRDTLLKSPLAKRYGLDLYATACKG